MVNAITPGSTAVSAAAASVQKTAASGQIFADNLKKDTQNSADVADIKSFLNKAREAEKMLTNYAVGQGDIEEIAPKLKELMLEFEVKTKIISSIANIIKSLTSMNI